MGMADPTYVGLGAQQGSHAPPGLDGSRPVMDHETYQPTFNYIFAP